MNNILESLKERMGKSIDSLNSSFNKIRTGRANPAILDDVKVDYYGSLTPLNQTSNITVEESRTLVISPWDKNLMPEIEKAIASSDLGLNPSSSGDIIRVTMPCIDIYKCYIASYSSIISPINVDIVKIERFCVIPMAMGAHII